MTSNKGRKWDLTTVLANLNPHRRYAVWEQLNNIQAVDPWVLIRDFTCTLRNGGGVQKEGLNQFCELEKEKRVDRLGIC